MMRRFFVLVVAISMSPALTRPAVADVICDELWFARNMIFAEAGYCFGSNLGKATFGHLGCSGGDIALDPETKAIVDRLRAREAEDGCAVDTSRSSLDIPGLTARMGLTDQPIRDAFESACIGWRRGPLDLWSGWRDGGVVFGQVQTGDTILFSHETVGDWSFVQAIRSDERADMGWVQLGAHDPEACDGWAG